MNTQEVKSLTRAVTGHLTPLEVMTLHTYASKVLDGHCVEIGSFRGLSTIALAKGIIDKPNTFVYAIDPHKPYVDVSDTNKNFSQKYDYSDYVIFIQNLIAHNVLHKILPIVSPSYTVEFEDEIGLLFIDGDHSFKSVSEDFRMYEKQVVHGGFIIFHDSAWSGPRQVIKYIRDYLWGSYKFLEEVDALTIFIKRIPKYD